MTQPEKSDSTKFRFLSAARAQFAKRGFYGASLANIAAELGMTKQTLLHYYKTKEQLYAAVLDEIACDYTAQIAEFKERIDDPIERLEAILVDRLSSQSADREDAQIVMRELLDNQERVQDVSHWYLKPWLDALTDIVLEIPGPKLTRPEAFAAIYQFLGAISYLGMSEPTLARMLGKKQYNQVIRAYPDQLKAMIRSRFG